jgi:hypothetical protein
MVQTNQNGLTVTPGSFTTLRSQFNQTGLAQLPGFLAPRPLELLLNMIESASFELKDEISRKSGAVFGTTQFMSRTDPVMIALYFLLNREALYDMAAEACAVPRPRTFTCRLHRTTAATDQHIDWHDDATDGRLLGLNINLSSERFGGGLFQLRDSEKRVTGEVKHTVPGDAFLFKIGQGWQHRLTRVESGVRTVAVGWFRLPPDWERWLSAQHG